jgi:predicted ATPase/DNA-binding SARP family transcriptional activator
MTLSSETTVSDLKPIPDLQVRLFGPFSVRVQGEDLPPLHSRKGAWLLALLVLKHPRPVERSWLAATLWPDSDPTAALKNLRNILSDLRHALGAQENRIQSPTPGTLRLDLAQAEVDLVDFEAGVKRGNHAALTEAVRLYAGPLLEGCDEEWVVLEREQRQQACLDALESLAHFELQAGQTSQAARHLHTCIAMDPFRETAQCALMTALAASGDYAGVTQVYRAFRLQLHEQLYTQPAAETLALYQKIRVRARQVAAGGAAPLTMPSLPRPLADISAAALPEESEAPPAGRWHNLPPALTSFIGREKECADIQELLAQTRLLTLTGMGGSGKTRLALEMARERAASYADGVWLVELAALSDPARVVQAAATALDIREQPQAPLLQTLVTTLQPKTLLLLLDNCEHLLGACADLAAALLRGCPSVRLLATSRERLGIAGEQVYRVPSLSLPDLNVAFSEESIQRYESVRLFVARACLIRSDFRVSAQNAGAVAQVCHRLDGIPLAIELAAARVRSLSVEELQRRLDNRFDLLTGGDRSALPRQQTLRDLIDWSYDLLNASEQRLLQRLSVFAGGWTLEAAEAVAGDRGQRARGGKNDSSLTPIEEADILDLLTSLVDKSLVIAEERDASARYQLLGTMRQYARERLVESGENNAVRERHRDYFLALAEEAEPKLLGAEQREWLQRLAAEHENLRGALDWSVSEKGASGCLRLCGVLSRFWIVHGHWSEGREWCVRALGAARGQERSQERGKALNGAGLLAYFQGDYASARAYHEESLAIQREIGDRYGIAVSLNGLGNVAHSQGDYASAQVYHEESLAIKREIGDRSGIAASLNNLGFMASYQGDYTSAQVYHKESLIIRREIGDRNGTAFSLGNLGFVASYQGDYASARAYHEESLGIQREIGDRRGIAYSLGGLGIVAFCQGDYASARAYHEESLIIRREIGDRWGMAYSLEAFAEMVGSTGKAEQAAVLWGAAEALREKIGAPLPSDERQTNERSVAAAREALGDEAFTTAWATGRAMTLEEAIALALKESVS